MNLCTFGREIGKNTSTLAYFHRRLERSKCSSEERSTVLPKIWKLSELKSSPHYKKVQLFIIWFESEYFHPGDRLTTSSHYRATVFWDEKSATHVV